MNMRIALIFIVLLSFNSFSKGIFQNGRALTMCEVQLTRYMNSAKFVREFGTASANFWYKDFDPKWMLSTFKTKEDIKKALLFLKEYATLDPIFIKNYKNFIETAMLMDRISLPEMKEIFKTRKAGSYVVSFAEGPQAVKALKKVKKHLIQFTYDPDRNSVLALKKILAKKKMSPFYQKEYRRILYGAGLSEEEYKLLAEVYVPRNKISDLKVFEDFIDYIKPRTQQYKKEALKKINSIFTPWDSTKDGIHISLFKRFRQKVNDHRERRIQFELNRRKTNGEEISENVKRYAVHKAKKETNIFRKLLISCGGTVKSKSLKSATKKFKKFKIGMSLFFGVYGYTEANFDKLDANYSILELFKKEMGLKSDVKELSEDADPYWFRRFFYETGVGLAFTFVNNLIITNPSTSAFHKGWNGYLKFSTMDAANAWGYDYLFKEDPKEIKKEFEKLRQDPEFQKKLLAILKEVEKNNPDTSIKKFMDKYFNFSVLKSKDDLEKITLEDLETEEARELVMELLAERAYQNGMGDIPIFQTGNTGMDRWVFYRAYNIPNTIKSVAVDLLLFNIMCMASGENATTRKKAIAFLSAVGIQLADKWITAKIHYPIRRKAVNQ